MSLKSLSVSGAAPISPDDPPPSNPYVDTMIAALESESGMAVEVLTKKDAQAMRHRFYRARQVAMERGVKSLDQLSIQIVPTASGYELHIKSFPFKVRPL